MAIGGGGGELESWSSPLRNFCYAPAAMVCKVGVVSPYLMFVCVIPRVCLRKLLLEGVGLVYSDFKVLHVLTL